MPELAVRDDAVRSHADGVMLRFQNGRIIAAMLELAARDNGTLHVALLWERETDVLVVVVDDSATGDSFQLVVDESNALDIYHHPYAYAAMRGVEYAVAA
ncbi:MAG: hypothetical protein ACJ74C_05805 [Gaiellaceae bacterium]